MRFVVFQSATDDLYEWNEFQRTRISTWLIADDRSETPHDF